MRRVGHLWQQIVAFENLHRASRAVLCRKRGSQAACEFHRNLETNLLTLKEQLDSATYRPGPYRQFWVTDPKPRLISAATIRDRVVHHAVVNILEPVFERRFIFHSYACRQKKGTHRALEQFVAWARDSRYVLKMDIRQFFPNIDHQMMMQVLSRAIKDARVLSLCATLLEAAPAIPASTRYFPQDDLFAPHARRRGLPIGNVTSQFFANVLLDQLDHFVLDNVRARRYLRYVDDFCVCGNDKRYLSTVLEAIRDFLATLRLELNARKSRLRQVREGIEFLGFVIFPHQLRLSQRTIRRQRRLMRSLVRQRRERLLSARAAFQVVRAIIAHAQFGTTWRHLDRVLVTPL